MIKNYGCPNLSESSKIKLDKARKTADLQVKNAGYFFQE